jgi:hypothetical protein
MKNISPFLTVKLKAGVKPIDNVSVHPKFKAMQHKDMSSAKKTS